MTAASVQISRRRRLRWQWQEWRYDRRMRLASWIAGFNVEND